MQDKKYVFLKEAASVRQCERLSILRLILTQPTLLYLLFEYFNEYIVD